MNLDDTTIHDVLLKTKYVSEEDLIEAKNRAAETNSTLVSYLLREGLLTRPLLSQAIAEFYEFPYVNLKSRPPTPEQVARIPEDIGKELRTVLVAEREGEVLVATDNLNKEAVLEELQEYFPESEITLAYTDGEDIDASFLGYKKPLDTRFSKIIEEEGRIAPEILEEIFQDAYIFHASDIHFEPGKDVVTVRFRVDGVLHEAGRIPKEYYENILNRIKVQSQLRIDEHLSAQDGSMHYEKDNFVFDMRTSVVPTVEGEKVALRVLTTYVKDFKLSDLGLTPQNQEIVEQASKKPFGMILMTGPTGSGKTTVLYSILKLIHTPEVNITTIEDPVEYKISGVNQIQVNSQTNLTFAKGLRSIVRQDPDIILVGEIRDRETAEIAVNAALTGHLLLSTFHSNDAATAIPRLLDMGIEPFLLASTLEIVAAQRLVRKICNECRYSASVSKKDLKEEFSGFSVSSYFPERKVTLYAGKGCSACGGTGYSGRTAIFEFIKVTSDMKELILSRPSANDVSKLARKEGTLSLFEDGMEKVKNGTTTMEELLRVAPPPS